MNNRTINWAAVLGLPKNAFAVWTAPVELADRLGDKLPEKMAEVVRQLADEGLIPLDGGAANLRLESGVRPAFVMQTEASLEQQVFDLRAKFMSLGERDMDTDRFIAALNAAGVTDEALISAGLFVAGSVLCRADGTVIADLGDAHH